MKIKKKKRKKNVREKSIKRFCFRYEQVLPSGERRSNSKLEQVRTRAAICGDAVKLEVGAGTENWSYCTAIYRGAREVFFFFILYSQREGR